LNLESAAIATQAESNTRLYLTGSGRRNAVGGLSSKAKGAQQIGRLTNIMQLTVDTTWYTRYRSTANPDFGAMFPQALPNLAAGQFTAIPRDDADFGPNNH
jgi:hypothetical protein